MVRKLTIWAIVLCSIVVVVVVVFTASYVTVTRRSSKDSEAEWLPEADNTLVLAHVLFRHGDRVPNNPAYSTNPINDSSYFPEGYGQISEKGKKVAYRIGTSLHQRYSWFLGATWNIKHIAARSTNVNRTKMSLQIMLGGLWPPSGNQVIHPSLNWQPIPFDLSIDDKELEGDKICKNFKTIKKEVENSAEIIQALSVYDYYWGYFSNVTGDNITKLQEVFDICVDQHSQRAYGYPLEPWVEEAMPIIEKMTRDVYYIETNNTELKQIAAGYLLKKIITDSRSMIDGVISPDGRKMFIYSAHERNMAFLLRVLDLYDDKVPSYGAHILIELHLVDGVYGFRIYHQDGSTNALKLMTVPGCQAFCPFDEFVSLYQELLPEDDFCDLS